MADEGTGDARAPVEQNVHVRKAISHLSIATVGIVDLHVKTHFIHWLLLTFPCAVRTKKDHRIV